MLKTFLHAALAVTVLAPVSSCKKKEGCTDKSAVNYDASAKVDDGSCIIRGCTDPTATNYNPKANEDDGSCTHPSPPPPTSGTYTDTRDGQTYKFKQIGSKVWMTKNMNYVTTEPSRCYANDSANCDEFGRLYSQAASATVCPAGWHLPSETEWVALIDHLGGMAVAGEHMSVGGSSGFEGKFGGWYNSQFGHLDIHTQAWWWSSTPGSFGYKGYIIAFNDSGVAMGEGYVEYSQLSCRCVKD